MTEGERLSMRGDSITPLVLPSLRTLDLPKVPTPQFTTPDEEWVLISTDVGIDAVYRQHQMPPKHVSVPGEGTAEVDNPMKCLF